MAKVEVTDRGKMLAALGYGGFFFGFPLGVIPLLMRDDEFALEHGKHATASWLLHFVLVMLLSAVVTVIATVTCGFGAILFPIILLPWVAGMVTAVHGLILSLNGDDAEPLGGMGLGNMVFGSISVNPDAVARLNAPPPAAPASPAAPPAAEEPPAASGATAAAPAPPPPPPAPTSADREVEMPTEIDESPVPPPPPPPASGATAAEPPPPPPPPPSAPSYDEPPPPPPLPPKND
jgi:hypothetical protein